MSDLYKDGYSAADFGAEPDVSRETLEAFTRWHGLLSQWNRKINLVSPNALSDYWLRHALDSWQLAAFLPKDVAEPLKILDLGSGAGFPGLAMAIAVKARNAQAGQGHVTLVESAGKKANFLRTVIRELSLPATVWAARAEDLAVSSPNDAYDIITARAFAPLPRLLTYAQPFWSAETKALLLKGQSATDELTEARKYWTFTAETQPSRSAPDGEILLIERLAAIAST